MPRLGQTADSPCPARDGPLEVERKGGRKEAGRGVQGERFSSTSSPRRRGSSIIGGGKVLREARSVAGRVGTFVALCFPKAVYGLERVFLGIAAIHANQVKALLFLRSRILDGSVFIIIKISCSTNIVRRA